MFKNYATVTYQKNFNYHMSNTQNSWSNKLKSDQEFNLNFPINKILVNDNLK